MSVLSDRQKWMYGSFGSKENPICNPNIQASVAGTNVFTYPITRVSGTEAMVTITPPYDDFQGTIILIPTAAFTWTNAGNIAVAGTAVAGRPVHLTYDPNAGKWYTHAIA